MTETTLHYRGTERITLHVLPDDLKFAAVATLIQRWQDAAPIASALPAEYVAGFFAELDALLAQREDEAIES